MLLNPYSQKLTTFEGTRLLLDTLGIVGAGIRDISDPRRFWTIQSIYTPVRRALGGIRVKLLDREDFVTFINQRDLEVLLGLARPKEHCVWSGTLYYGPDDPEWVGFCMDENDLRDDLQEREMLLRAKHPGVLPFGVEIERKYHADYNADREELLTLLWDMDPSTGIGPDYRLETIAKRWTRIELRKITWRSDSYGQTRTR